MAINTSSDIALLKCTLVLEEAARIGERVPEGQFTAETKKALDHAKSTLLHAFDLIPEEAEIEIDPFDQIHIKRCITIFESRCSQVLAIYKASIAGEPSEGNPVARKALSRYQTSRVRVRKAIQDYFKPIAEEDGSDSEDREDAESDDIAFLRSVSPHFENPPHRTPRPVALPKIIIPEPLSHVLGELQGRG